MMVAETLLRPDNRLLTFSVADFSNYGAQPDPAFVVRPLGTNVPVDHSETQSESVHTDAPVGDAGATVGYDIALSGDRSAASDDAHATQATVSPVVEATIAPHDVQGDPAAQPVMGSGTPPAQLFDTPQSVSIGDQAQAGAHAGGAPASLDSVQDAGASNLDALHDALPATGAADATTAFVLNTVGDASAPLTGVAETIVDTLATAADTATSAVGDTVVDTLATTADTATSAVGDTVGSGAAAPVGDGDIAQLSGADPAAGVATLVDMVATENIFDLRDAGAAPDVGADNSSSIDSLIGDAGETSPLLGEAAHHDDAASPTSDLDTHHDLGI